MSRLLTEPFLATGALVWTLHDEVAVTSSMESVTLDNWVVPPTRRRDREEEGGRLVMVVVVLIVVVLVMVVGVVLVVGNVVVDL